MSCEVHLFLCHVQCFLHLTCNKIWIAIFAETLLSENLKWIKFLKVVHFIKRHRDRLTRPTKLSADPTTSNELGRPPWGLDGVDWARRWLIPFLSVTTARKKLQLRISEKVFIILSFVFKNLYIQQANRLARKAVDVLHTLDLLVVIVTCSTLNTTFNTTRLIRLLLTNYFEALFRLISF